MDITRAKQIISSPAEIDVLYHGQSVWLVETDESTNTVSVKSKTDSDEILELPVEELEEGARRT